MALWPEVASKASENFLTHAENGYYNGIIFHRVIKGFMLPGGDPTGTGRGGESIWKAPFEDEVSDQVKFDRPGLLAMANSGPRSNGSQFFITVAATPWLDGRHAIFGEVTSGMDIAKQISMVSRDPGDKPVKEIKMIKVTVVK